MKVAIIGASGFIGSGILSEALTRGHQVTALVGHPERLTAQNGLTVVGINVMDTEYLAMQLTGHDAVITAFSGNIQPDVRSYYVRGVNSIINAVKQAGVPRLLVVGGAGSLEVKAGVKVMDNPAFPPEWKGAALGLSDILEQLRSEKELGWTFLSPAADIVPGQRTGRFRLGNDQLMVDATGHSRISIEDYALAMVDELETPLHTGRRFSIAY